ncbi:uncharacterized protein EHS24_005339 [Apiotrichum porosum]|uniref:Mog1p/PsbP-like protein n=1 Tax=Apiotrichum porosum TaxID=105984 RepID=A0A427XCY1_9TREE|nr:uncharacterized protein EHS24_005339 [Apiotrichum porosum]RSH76761.1 hypothetical protein EHS24_005339 [Apiotrichum porosum]
MTVPTTTTMALQPRQLFGGAITMPIPVGYLDASDMRQVPDNQEVFLSPDSDTSIIIEILAPVDEGGADQDLWEAATFHFASVAHDNAALSSTVITTHPPIPAQQQTAASFAALTSPAPVALVGTQRVHKFSHDPTGAPRRGHESDTPDEVWIALALYRVDVVVGASIKKADVVVTANVNASAAGGADEVVKVQKWLDESAKGFKIVDWGLFGDQ